MITSDLSLSCSNLVRLFKRNKVVVVVVAYQARINEELCESYRKTEFEWF